MGTHFLRPLLAGTGGPFQLVNERTGRTVATAIETAFDSASRNRGLLGRPGFAPGHALIIAPTRMVHTFFMRFPIDLLFVARDGRVLKVRLNVPAWRIAGVLRGFAVIEMAAHEVAESGTVAGDRLLIRG